MKIAYVSNSRFPSERAHAVQIVQMCNAFVQQGNEVSLLVTSRPTHITQSPEEFYGVQLAFLVVRISTPDIAGNAHKLPKFLQPLAYTMQRIIFAVYAWQHIKSNKFDCVYGRDEWILLLLWFMLRVPVVWESHEAKYSLVARWLLARSKKVVVISEGIRDFYIAKGIPEENILVAHDAIDESFFEKIYSKQEAQTTLGITTEKPVVMYIGGLDKWKGVDVLFEAAQSNKEKFSVFVVGGTEMELNMFKEKYPYINFLGPRPYKELKNLQQAADILIIPNTAKNELSAKYTSPLKLFAHLTSTVPLVVSDIPSIRNVITEKHAFFFEADNSKSLSQAIHAVLSDRSGAVIRAHNALELSKKYTWRNRAEEIVKFISS